MKFGIFGGTFDPCTKAHYEIVKKILDDKIVDKVIVLPSIVSYHRDGKKSLFNYSEKRKILEKWFSRLENVILDFSEYEIPEDEISSRRYWHMLRDTVYKYDYDCMGSEFYTIVGGDSWNNLDKWFRYENLLEYTKFIVVQRNGCAFKTYAELEKKAEPIIVTIDRTTLQDISATKEREKLLNKVTSEKDILEVYLSEIDDYLQSKK